tara:strand:- start:441 stop:848 length:408 start_codon:yes stop_codon:yes gene_type:complete
MTTATASVLTEDQQILLEELKAMNLFGEDQNGIPLYSNQEESYQIFMKELSDIGCTDLRTYEDWNRGCWSGDTEQAGAKYAEDLANDCGEAPDTKDSWIELKIDWNASWDNISSEYCCIEMKGIYGLETYIFCVA